MDAADRYSTPWAVVALGICALAVAMGIGRFAFTPLMPLMLRDGTISAATGAEWAAANYIGYLAGALTASRFASDPRRGMLAGLFGVAMSTLASGVVGATAMHTAGLAMRAIAGVCSAWTLVCVSGWCLADLARRGVPRLGAWVYTGVGLGIAGAGTIAWIGGQQPATALWLEFGALATAGALLIWRYSVKARSPHPAPARAAPSQTRTDPVRGNGALVWCYGTFGYGYIVQATFLPAMARQQVSDPLVFGLTWPLFGLAATLSVAGAARWLSGWPRRQVWAAAQGVMAIGTALPLATHELWALAASAVLVGGTFMVTTMAGLQLARERAPSNPTPLLARMTIAFASGQIAGPALVRVIGPGLVGGHDAFFWANALATLMLVLTASWLGFERAPDRTPRVA